MSALLSELVREDERTMYEAMGDADYAIRYMLLQERLFARLGIVFKFISLFGGSAAVGGVAINSPLLTSVSGILVALSSILDIVIKPEEKALQCRGVSKRYYKLIRKADRHTLEEHDRKAAKIALLPTPQIEGLRVPAYNESSIERGRPDYTQPLNSWQRLLHWLA
ncbi:hypothetical protein [Vreelandella lutescens]|uniref:SMODS and SLOG-associating 2TM effector domain-containing protein n=1 Tax=Vreelandella lutescens TaxID=1602943 RepID=A0ABQ1NVR9_9GAMM|nr:hypothetical protein [Halomonas lutescens]GGC83897.1 hypothetical protein GCM10011382_12570 [Halomonas lutescens]